MTYGTIAVMSVTDPNCGICKTLKMPSGKTLVINHEFPKALVHHYALPALGDSTIPIYRGSFDHAGTRYRGSIAIELEPRPNLVAHGVREITLPEGLEELLGRREPAKWVNYDQLSVPARTLPAPAKTARPPRCTQDCRCRHYRRFPPKRNRRW